jgi:hypothetical protein
MIAESIVGAPLAKSLAMSGPFVLTAPISLMRSISTKTIFFLYIRFYLTLLYSIQLTTSLRKERQVDVLNLIQNQPVRSLNFVTK